MSDEANKPNPAEKLAWVTPPDGVAEIYSNCCEVTWNTGCDVHLRFGHAVPHLNPPRRDLIEKVGVTIPISLIAYLLTSLHQCVADHQTTASEANPKTRGAN